MSVHKYSVTPDSNTSVGDGSDAVGLQEGMPRQNVNNAMRAIASDIAKNYKDHGSLVTAGTGTAYTVFAQSDFTAYFVGLSLVVKLHADCGANATINVNGRGAKQLRMRGPSGVTNVEANALRANEVVHIVYNGTQFHVLGAFDFASIHSRISTLETQATSGTVNNADKLDGQHGAFYQNASNLNVGTIENARLPERLQVYAHTVTDWNDAETNGWYMADGAANAPTTGWLLGEVVAHNGIWTTQTVHGFVGDSDGDTRSYRREQDNGTWGAWYRLRISQTEQETIYRNASNLNAGTVPLARLPSGSGAGLDSDMLDGQHGSFYQNAGNLNAGTVPSTRLSGVYNIGITGNAATATRLATARNIALTGDVSGSANFDGSGNITISAAVGDNSHNHNWITNGDPADGPDYALEFFNRNGDLNTNPTIDWWNTIRMGHGDPNTYYNTTLAVKMTGLDAGDIYTRVKSAGANGTWRRHWSDANDGAGSGLDADLLDGQHASNFATQGYNQIGSYIFANNNGGGTVYPGEPVAGSSLRPTGAHSESADSYALSGTWRCMGYKYGSNTSFDGEAESTLWVRIA